MCSERGVIVKFHINSDNEVKECRDTTGRCPYANFDSKEDAFRALNISVFSQNKKSQDFMSIYGTDKVYPYSMSLDSNVEKLLGLMYHVGSPYIVGGSVRDSFAGADSKDIDIEVHNVDIDSLIDFLKKKNYKVDEVGKSFGVLKVSKNGVNDIDVSVPRLENKMGAGHRNFDVELRANLTIDDAVRRRDFTINAMMYDHKRKNIVDITNGSQDFQNKILRHVSESFSEDPLRVLRGVQFASRFNMTLAPETARLCKSLRSEFSSLSNERLQGEWAKFYTRSTVLKKGIKALQDTGWDNTLPGLEKALKTPLMGEKLQKLTQIPKNNRIIIGSALLMNTMNQEDKKKFAYQTINGKREQARAILYSNINSEDLLHNNHALHNFSRNLKSKNVSFEEYDNYVHCNNDVNGIKTINKVKQLGIYSEPEAKLLNINELLAKTGVKSGAWLKDVSQQVQYAQDMGEIKDSKSALAKALFIMNNNNIIE